MYHDGRNPLFLKLLLLVALPLVLCPASSSSSTILSTTSAHGTLSIATVGNVTTVTISNPPINLYDFKVSSDVFAFLSSLDPSKRTTPPPKVVIFRSANPDFFIPHIDVTSFLPPPTPDKGALIEDFLASLQLLRNLTTSLFIAEIDGETSGGGGDFILSFDMRFAGPKAKVSSLDVSLGVTVLGSSGQFLSRLVNKARALQYLVSSDYADCKTGKELGWFNDCFESTKELGEKVAALAARIGLRPQGALNATKAALQTLNPTPSELAADAVAYSAAAASPLTEALTAKLLALGHQDRSPFELGMPGTLVELYE